MTATILRMQAYRERLRAGRIKLLIEVDEAQTEATLERAGVLAENTDHTRAELAAGVECVLARLAELEA